MSGLDSSLFVTDEVIERKVQLGRGKREFTFYFKLLSQKDFERFNAQRTSANEAERDASTPWIIAASLCEPDGTPALTPEKAATLKQGVVNSLMAEILAVNDVGDAGKD